MQPRTLYIYMTDSALFLAREGQDGNAGIRLASFEISPSTPFAAVLNDAAAWKDDMQAGADRIRVVVDSPAVLVPMSEFSEDNFREYYDYCIPSDSERRIFCDPLPAANAMLVFSVAENIFKTLCDRFENVHFCSSMTSVAGYFIKKASHTDTPRRLLAVVREGAVDIVVVEAGRLLSVNSFEVGAVSDVLYYVLGTASKLGLSAPADTFCIAGDVRLRENSAAELGKFVGNVSTLEQAREFGEYTTDTDDEVPFNMMAAIAEN